jgi:hypothetical protein
LFPSPTRHRFVQAVVLSVFEYYLPVYGNVISLGYMNNVEGANICERYGLREFFHISLERVYLGLLPMDDLVLLRR